MNILQNKKFRAATWLDTSRIVEGTLQLLDLKTLEAADPKVNKNGHLMTIEDINGCIHLIAPDTLEIVENPNFSIITQLLLDKGLTTEDLETFWKSSMLKAVKLCLDKKPTELIFLTQGRSFGKNETMKLKVKEMLENTNHLVSGLTYSANESSSKYIGKSKNNYKK